MTTNPGEDSEPSWSPDGKWITYLTKLDPKLFQYGTLHVAISPAGGGPAKVVTQKFDRMSRWPRFSPDGKYVVVSNAGTDDVSIIDVKSRREVARVKTGKIPKRVVIASVPTTRSPGAAK